MNTELNTNHMLAGTGIEGALSPRSVVASLLELVGRGFREMWAGYVRSLDRAGALPPQL